MSRPLDRERLPVLVHEVRSPVAALSAIAETFVDTDPHAPDRAELARLSISACRALERIVVDAVTTSIRHELVDPGALVRGVVATATLTGAPVEANVEPDLAPVSGDAVRLRQALDNLVANALLHSGSTAPVVVGAGAEGDVVRLFVTDEGAGIAGADQRRIFEAGERLDFGRPGSGLGLAIVEAIAKAHGGRLTVESAPGEGATFTITVPRVQPETVASSS